MPIIVISKWHIDLNTNFGCLFIYLFSDCVGDWLLILVHYMKYMRLQSNDSGNSTETRPLITLPGNENGSLPFFIFVSALGSYVIYFSIGGFLHVSSFSVTDLWFFNCP